MLPVSIIGWSAVYLSQLYFDPERIGLKKKFTACFVTCLAVFLLIPALSGKISFVDSLADSSRNWLSDLVIHISKEKPFGGSDGIDISILAVDESTYRQWGEPYITPRKAIADMIDFASKYKAAVVVVDFDLSRSEAWRNQTDGDVSLKAYLEKIDHSPAGTVPAVILLHDVGREQDEKRMYGSFLNKGTSLGDHKGNVFWATSTLPVDKDMVVRRFNWFENYAEDGVSKRMPSVQLLASYILYQLKNNPEDSAAAIEKSHQWIQSVQTKMPDAALLSQLSGVKIADDFNYQPSIIMIHASNKLEIRMDQYSALLQQAPENPAYYQHGIVFIGTMHGRTLDKHESAIGEKFGVELLAQSTATINHYGSLQELKGAWLWLYNIILLLTMSLLLLLPGYLFIVSASAVVGMLVYLPAAVLLYQQGLTLDAGPPVLLVELVEPVIPIVISAILNVGFLISNRQKLGGLLKQRIRQAWSQ